MIKKRLHRQDMREHQKHVCEAVLAVKGVTALDKMPEYEELQEVLAVVVGQCVSVEVMEVTSNEPNDFYHVIAVYELSDYSFSLFDGTLKQEGQPRPVSYTHLTLPTKRIV